MLLIVRVPVAEPLDAGVKLTVSCIDFPTARVNGATELARENPVPDTLTEETLTDADPVFVIVAVAGCVLLTTTLPKLSVGGVDDNVPC